jgi:hypothetical protein
MDNVQEVCYVNNTSMSQISDFIFCLAGFKRINWQCSYYSIVNEILENANYGAGTGRF